MIQTTNSCLKKKKWKRTKNYKKIQLIPLFSLKKYDIWNMIESMPGISWEKKKAHHVTL